MTRAVYVDVDDTLIRSFGSKRLPMDATVRLVKSLHAAGATLFCWSRGGADYARKSAAEAGVESCFTAFLPKPDVLIDDVAPDAWGMQTVHPSQSNGVDVKELVK
jgi:hypothetical protein